MFNSSLHSLIPVACSGQKLLKEKENKRQTGKLEKRLQNESKLFRIMLVCTFNYRTANSLIEIPKLKPKLTKKTYQILTQISTYTEVFQTGFHEEFAEVSLMLSSHVERNDVLKGSKSMNIFKGLNTFTLNFQETILVIHVHNLITNELTWEIFLF